MTVEPKYNYLQCPLNPENTKDTSKEPFERQWIEREQKLLIEWYYHLNTVSIPMMLKNETSSLRIFGGAFSAYRAFYLKMTETKKMLVKLLHRLERKKQQ